MIPSLSFAEILVTPWTSQAAIEIDSEIPVVPQGEVEWIAWDRTGEILWRDVNSPAWWYKNNIEDPVKVKGNNINCSPAVHKTRSRS